jgi:hypothetical protein
LARITNQLYQKHNLKPEEATRLIAERQSRLPGATAVSNLSTFHFEPAAGKGDESFADRAPATGQDAPIWGRPTDGLPNGVAGQHKRGPKADMDNHHKVARLISQYGEAWAEDETLSEICAELDGAAVPIPKTWPRRTDGKSRSWARALEHYPHLVVKAIKDRCKMARRNYQAQS